MVSDFQLPRDPRPEHFEALIRHESSCYRSGRDYSGLSHEDLVLELVATESPARELVCTLIDDPARESNDIYTQAVSVVRAASPDVLRMLHERGATTEQLRSIVRTRIKLDGIYAELRRRFDPLPLGAALYKVMVQRPEARQALLRALRNEKITSYRQNKESDEDLRSIAVEAGWEKFTKIFAEAADSLGLPEQVVIPSGGEGQRFNWEELRKSEIDASLALFVPLLRGDAEKIPEAARQRLRDHFEHWEAAKRQAPEISLSEEDEKRRPLVERIRPDEPTPEELVISKLQIVPLLEVALERWGDKGRAFVQALSEGNNVTEAAKAAGVSRQTAHKYVRELRRYARNED